MRQEKNISTLNLGTKSELKQILDFQTISLEVIMLSKMPGPPT